MAALAVDPDGMVRKVLRREAEGMPKELADLYEALNDCNMGVGVVTRLYEVWANILADKRSRTRARLTSIYV